MRKLNRNQTFISRLTFCLPLAITLAFTPLSANAAPKKEGKKNQAQPSTDKASLKNGDEPKKATAEDAAKTVSASAVTTPAATPAASPANPAKPPAAAQPVAGKPGAAAPPQSPNATAKKGAEPQKLFSTDFSEAPTNITSDSLTLKNDKRVFVYLGNVVVVQGNMTLTCEELEGTYTEENEIDKLYAKRNVVIIKAGETPDQNVKATSQHAVFDNKTQIATLTKNPQVEQNGSVLTADLIKMYLEEDRSVAEGQVRVTLVQQSKPDDKPKKEGKTALLGAK